MIGSEYDVIDLSIGGSVIRWNDCMDCSAYDVMVVWMVVYGSIDRSVYDRMNTLIVVMHMMWC